MILVKRDFRQFSLFNSLSFHFIEISVAIKICIKAYKSKT